MNGQPLFTIPISREDLVKMKVSGNAEIRIWIKNTETGEESEMTIQITPDQIDQMLRVMEAGDRAMRN